MAEIRRIAEGGGETVSGLWAYYYYLIPDALKELSAWLR